MSSKVTAIKKKDDDAVVSTENIEARSAPV